MLDPLTGDIGREKKILKVGVRRCCHYPGSVDVKIDACPAYLRGDGDGLLCWSEGEVLHGFIVYAPSLHFNLFDSSPMDKNTFQEFIKDSALALPEGIDR